MVEKFAYCKVNIAPLRSGKSDASEMVSQLLFGELIVVTEQDEKWFLVRSMLDNYEGYCDPKHIIFLSEKEMKRWMDGLSVQYELIRFIQTPWGKQLISKGAFVPFGNQNSFTIGNDFFEYLENSISEVKAELNSIREIAESYLNTPYLWGGKSPFGIDCSGFTQLVYRCVDINLPRDAYQQAELGEEIPFDERQENDLAFFSNEAGKIIHVGILIEPDRIIHASGCVRIDLFDKKGIYNESTEKYSHNLTTIKRIY
jgi:gamma-D-glutamyl-L-lysine dipeptidyl-peptidase